MRIIEINAADLGKEAMTEILAQVTAPCAKETQGATLKMHMDIVDRHMARTGMDKGTMAMAGLHGIARAIGTMMGCLAPALKMDEAEGMKHLDMLIEVARTAYTRTFNSDKKAA